MTSDTETTKVRVSRHFAAPAERVFDAWLDPEKACKFLFATPTGQMVRVEIDPRVGGKFAIVERRDGQDAEHLGEYLEIDRPRRLVFVYGVAMYSTTVDRVTVKIRPLDTGCELTLTHDLSPEYAGYASRCEQSWAGILAGLSASLGM